MTLINFAITREGLEDQLLTQAIQKEQPELEERKQSFDSERNRRTAELKVLEDLI